ncbi:MAG: 3-methyl-2-oxobutanoate hydroxymethyltransferase [Fimbriimonadaceae bacterium]|nr:3-methyl-2-oxobutanoate hydroxymethyltransferase [Fimbriimonadaceae bacterium]
MASRMTAPRIRAMKEEKTPIVCVTAYDALGGRLAESANVDLVLVGDSLGNVIMGQATTLGVTLPVMQHHVRCVATSCKTPLLVADMPFGSYGGQPGIAFDNAVELMRSGAQAVKLEGWYITEIGMMVRAGIPTMGHVGFTPQSVHVFGGHRVQGKGDDGDAIVDQAKAIQDAGAFAIVLELMPPELAQRITKELTIPTIGIGAGPHCDGQIQVFHDVLGLTPHHFKHAERYIEGESLFESALKQYCQAVREKTFKVEVE